jgi:hypothetical protein
MCLSNRLISRWNDTSSACCDLGLQQCAVHSLEAGELNPIGTGLSSLFSSSIQRYWIKSRRMSPSNQDQIQQNPNAKIQLYLGLSRVQSQVHYTYSVKPDVERVWCSHYVSEHILHKERTNNNVWLHTLQHTVCDVRIYTKVQGSYTLSLRSASNAANLTYTPHRA